MLAELPRGHVGWGDRRLRPAWAILLAIAAVAAVAWPQVMVNGDEYLYAGQARTLLRGRVVPQDGDPLPAPPGDPGVVLRYPLGWPALLAPAAAFGFRSLFVVPLLLHLLGVATVARLLVRRGLPAFLCVAWALHPAILPWWRTLMSDVPATALLLCALDAWEEERAPLSGALLGASLLVRMGGLLPALGVGLVALAQRRWRGAVWLVAGGLLGGAGVLLGNVLMHGDPIRAPYTASVASLFGAHQLPVHLLLYGGCLLLLPPFPLAALLAAPRRCDRWAMAAIPPLLFALLYDFHDLSPRWAETFLGGQRLLLPALALLSIATARVWAVPSLFRLERAAPLLAALGIAAGIFGTRRLYRRYEPAVARVRSCAPSSVAYNTNAARVALSSDAGRYLLADDRDPARLADLVVIAPRAPSNRFATVVTQPLPASLRDAPCERVGEFWIWDERGRCLPASARCPAEP